MTTDPVPFGLLLKWLRRETGLTQEILASRAGYSVGYISKLERGERPPTPATAELLAQALTLSEEHRSLLQASALPTPILARRATDRRRDDWGEAPAPGHFYGREQELASLSQVVLSEQKRVIAILGLGGMGKTALAARFAEQIREEFTFLFWRSLYNAPSLSRLLLQCLELLAQQTVPNLPASEDEQRLLFLSCLREQRCLLIFDNVDALLLDNARAGWREGYNGYGRLIREVAETSHHSCLLLTSRIKPKEVAVLGGTQAPLSTMHLSGLDLAAGRNVLEDAGLFGSDASYAALISRYAGNPLALHLLADPIREVFGGEIDPFLRAAPTIFGDIRELLREQIAPLSVVEQDLLFWLTIAREPLTFEALCRMVVRPVAQGTLLEALDTLLRRSLIERNDSRQFALQPVVMDYLTDHLVQRACQEVIEERSELLMSHALLEAQAHDFVRDSQRRLILRPVAECLLTAVGKAGFEEKCRRLLAALHTIGPQQPGYAAGNILNLLLEAGCDLRGFDFSQLSVWQAVLQGERLQDVNFAHADLSTSVFTDTFTGILWMALSRSGKRVAAVTTSNEIRVWQVQDGVPLLSCRGHDDWVYTVAWSPDERQLASGSNDRTIRLWDADSGALLATLHGHTGPVWSVAFSPDGNWLASGSSDQTVRLWNVASGASVITLVGEGGPVWSVAFSPDGSRIAVSHQNGTIAIWEVAAGTRLLTLHGHQDRVRSLAFHPNGRRLISGSDDETVRLWDTVTGERLLTLAGHSGWVRSVAWSPTGECIASGGIDQTIRLWDAGSGDLLRVMREHSGYVTALAFGPDGNWLVSSSDDQTVRLWDEATGECLMTLRGYSGWVRSVAWSPDERLLASSSDDQTVRLWDIASGRLRAALRDRSGYVTTVAFSPDGRLLASGSIDPRVRLWETESGVLLNTLHGHSGRVWTVTFSPDGRLLASGGDDRTIRLWDFQSGECQATLPGHSHCVIALAFGPDGRLLASCSDDASVPVWDVERGALLMTLSGHTGWVRSVAFSPDGKLLASGSIDQTVRLWDVASGECLMTLTGHTGWIRSVAFSPDGKRLATGSTDGTVRLWDVASGESLMTLRGHRGRIWSVAFSPSGHLLASGGHDGTIRLWDAESGACVQTMSNDRPYEGMTITGATGLTGQQRATLKALGAIDEERRI